MVDERRASVAKKLVSVAFFTKSSQGPWLLEHEAFRKDLAHDGHDTEVPVAAGRAAEFRSHGVVIRPRQVS